MEIRKTQLPHHIEYFLDGASESMELDGGSYFLCHLYGDPDRLAAIVDPPLPLTPERAMAKDFRLRERTTREICHDLINYADSLLPQIPVEQRGAVVYAGFSWIKYAIDQLAECQANWAVTDATVGGCLQPFLKKYNLKRNGSIPPRLNRRLHAPNFIRRYVKSENGSLELRAVCTQVMRRCATVPKEYVKSGHLVADMERQRQAFPLSGEQETLAVDLADRTDALVDAPQRRVKLSAKGRRELRARRKVHHRVLRRAAVIASAVLGASTVSALARGEPIKIEGDTAKFELTRRDSLARVGHGALRVSMLDKSDRRIAELCVYFEGTPAIDQAVAFSLYAKAGLESEIIETANVTSREEGADHPLLAAKRAARAEPAVADVMTALNNFRHEPYDRWRARCEQYWNETRGIWIEALTVFVTGQNRRARA
jgi:hypothetical protein